MQVQVFDHKFNRLFASITASIFAGAVIIGLVYLVIASYMCSDKIYSNIGEFQSEDDAIRASIRKLSAEIQRCPEAELYRIIWEATDQYGKSRHGLLYERRFKSIGIEDDVESGLSRKGYTVDDAAIKGVAEKGGTIDDFSDYDQRQKKAGD